MYLLIPSWIKIFGLHPSPLPISSVIQLHTHTNKVVPFKFKPSTSKRRFVSGSSDRRFLQINNHYQNFGRQHTNTDTEFGKTGLHQRTTQYAFVEPWPSLGIKAFAATTSTKSLRTVIATTTRSNAPKATHSICPHKSLYFSSQITLFVLTRLSQITHANSIIFRCRELCVCKSLAWSITRRSR